MRVSFPGLSSPEPLEADYTDWERERVRTLGLNPATVREVRLIHEIKARLDARIVEQPVGEQPALAVPDAAASRAAKEEAIRRVDRGAEPEWKDRALEAWRAVCLVQPIFTPDDLWTRVEKPREPRALGPVAQRAVRRGYCEPTGRLVKSKMPTQHQNMITEYRSLLFAPEQAALVDDAAS